MYKGDPLIEECAGIVLTEGYSWVRWIWNMDNNSDVVTLLTQPAAPWHYFKLKRGLEQTTPWSMHSSGRKSSVLFMGMNKQQVCGMFWGSWHSGWGSSWESFSLRILKRHLWNCDDLQSIAWMLLLALKMGVYFSRGPACKGWTFKQGGQWATKYNYLESELKFWDGR